MIWCFIFFQPILKWYIEIVVYILNMSFQHAFNVEIVAEYYIFMALYGSSSQAFSVAYFYVDLNFLNLQKKVWCRQIFLNLSSHSHCFHTVLKNMMTSFLSYSDWSPPLYSFKFSISLFPIVLDPLILDLTSSSFSSLQIPQR